MMKETDLARYFQQVPADESGATAIEYGLNAAGISIAIMAAVNGLGTNLGGKFNSINSAAIETTR